MMLLAEFRFISGFLFAYLYFFSQAAFTQQAQIPVDGCVTYIRIFNSYRGKQFFYRYMFLSRKKCIENFLSLPRIAQTLFPYVASENIFGVVYNHMRFIDNDICYQQ